MALEITDQNFISTINNNKVVVVDFWATWCGPCRGISPVIEELANEFKGRAIIGKLDVDRNSATTAQFGIRNIPAILFFKNGKMVDKIAGGIQKSNMISRINSLING